MSGYSDTSVFCVVWLGLMCPRGLYFYNAHHDCDSLMWSCTWSILVLVDVGTLSISGVFRGALGDSPFGETIIF